MLLLALLLLLRLQLFAIVIDCIARTRKYTLIYSEKLIHRLYNLILVCIVTFLLFHFSFLFLSHCWYFSSVKYQSKSVLLFHSIISVINVLLTLSFIRIDIVMYYVGCENLDCIFFLFVCCLFHYIFAFTYVISISAAIQLF